MNKQAKLDQIAAEIVKNNVCPDLAKTAKHLVPGEGNPDANIVFIGEAPGKKEDETGRPFVGASGKFLEELLAGIGLERKDVFITSILKYRPPNNRDPRPAEKAQFWPYLLAQLEVIAPKLVVTLGRHSATQFLPDFQMERNHGKVHLWVDEAGPVGQSFPQRARSAARAGGPPMPATRRRYHILPLYHPAAALYNGSLRQTIIKDFETIKEFINQQSI